MAASHRPSRVLVVAMLSAALALACNGGESSLSGPTPVASITLQPNVLSLEPGHVASLTAILRDERGATLADRPVAWASDNPGVATVDKGMVVGVREGVAEITATVDGLTAKATILVAISVSLVEITPASPLIRVGGTVQLTGTPRGPDGNALPGRVVSWSTSDARIARVSVGKVRGIAVGTAVIEARADNRRGTTTVTVVPNISGPWVIVTALSDPARGISCTGAGRLAIEQPAANVGGTIEHDTICEAAGGPAGFSGSFAIEDASLSPTRVDFIHLGALRCAFVGELAGTPPTAAAGPVSCSGEVDGASANLQGQWQMRR